MSENEKVIYDPLRDAGEKIEQTIENVSRELFEYEQKLELVKQRIARLEEHGIGFLGAKKLQDAQRERVDIEIKIQILKDSLKKLVKDIEGIAQNKAVIDFFKPIIEPNPKKRN